MQRLACVLRCSAHVAVVCSGVVPAICVPRAQKLLSSLHVLRWTQG
jgi:hypothetical protein